MEQFGINFNKDWSVYNLIAGTRMDIKGGNWIDTGVAVIKVLLDENKEWNVKETPWYSKEDALLIDGYDEEKGNRQFLLLIKKERAYDQKMEEFLKEWKLV